MPTTATIKVFQLNDNDWWAGESLEACLAQAHADCGDDTYNDASEYRELTDEQMQSTTFVDITDDGAKEEHRTFAEQLEREIASGTTFPCLFASIDW